ncbi:MAG TPA: ATP-binding protein [Nitrososphaeraceae archaeon]
MLKYYTNNCEFIRSKLGSKIVVFVFILIILVITSFIIFSYYQSQMTYLGNSINIAGKNRFLTSTLMFDISKYLIEDSNKDVSKINSAINQLEFNILVLKEGGKAASIDLMPLQGEFLNDWNKVYQKWISLKTIIANNIIKPSDENIGSIDKLTQKKLETEALSLVNLSNILVTKLGEYVKSNSENLLFNQRVFIILDIAVIAAFVLYLTRKIVKPILSLTSAISDVNRGTLNLIAQSKGNNDDELSVIGNSFNYMTNFINKIKKQDELINELEKANQELKYKDQLKNEFINVAAHEIKTPIQPIIALSELLQQEGINNIEKNKELLNIILRNSKRLKQLTEDVLDVARIETGSFFLNKEKFNLKEMITDVLKEYEQTIQNKNYIKFFLEFNDNKEIIIEADRNRLSQVIHNLLHNAIKFTKEGSITIIVERKKDNTNDKYDEILVSIKDTGTGIHPEVMPKLFTKFVTKSPIAGTGLGLFISKSIIEMHGGKIWATNNKEKDKGVGSTFTFSLPLKQ